MSRRNPDPEHHKGNHSHNFLLLRRYDPGPIQSRILWVADCNRYLLESTRLYFAVVYEAEIPALGRVPLPAWRTATPSADGTPPKLSFGLLAGL
jgi:hypothetical protein